MITSSAFTDYSLLDAGDKEKLESWHGVILRRPDPLAVWPKTQKALWQHCDAVYHREKGGGHWECKKAIKDLTVRFQDLAFKVALTDFKHTGLFPEQAANWEFIKSNIHAYKTKYPLETVKVLNLFAYTGAATLAAASGGADETVHVDAAKGMVEWAKENRHRSALDDRKIRFIVDDCQKFIEREKRRGHHYSAIIMDPPTYGHGPAGELFKFSEQINPLLKSALTLLSAHPLFIIINSYTTGYSPTVLKNIILTQLAAFPDLKATVTVDELGLKINASELCLPAGLTARITFKEA